ncbi:MAG: CDP-glycerol glycerophosphotransferase family protein, partial [Nocardioides sp.]
KVLAEVHDGHFDVELELTHDVYRFKTAPLPPGEHDVVVSVDEGSPVSARLSVGLLRTLPMRRTTDLHDLMVGRNPGGGLRVSIPPAHRRPDRRAELGRVTRRARTRRGVATHRGILFRSYFGELATDNGLAIQAELTRRGCDLPVYWAVQNNSLIVPEGGIAVLVNSPEWFELLASVTYYVDNMYQPDYHLKPDGQILVQTFHGYPFKQMGLPHWRALSFPQEQIDSYHRRTAEWDYLLSPASYATPLLTRAFGYDGPVLEIGYPRNDILLSADAERIRQLTRDSLGIRADQTAVLYAPTFRDYLARHNHRAAMSDFLDIEMVDEAFGDDMVVMVRGHAFHARTNTRVGTKGTIIDVTDYPEVSDLYLAADVGVVDYSSLRFDFGVTGKPMIYLVPDLHRYIETRGWLFDFEPTAPGPLVSTTAEVIEHLGDLSSLRTGWAENYQRFRRTYLDLEDGRAAERFVDAVIAPKL